MSPTVSAVMPCLNEEQTLEVCIRKAQSCFAAMGIEGEVVVADNGSTDGSVELAQRLGARVVLPDDQGLRRGTQRRHRGGARRDHRHGGRRRLVRLGRVRPLRRRRSAKDTTWSSAIASRAASSPAQCLRCIAISATRCYRRWRASCIAPRSAIFIAVCVPSPRPRSSACACGPRAWSSPPRWW